MVTLATALLSAQGGGGGGAATGQAAVLEEFADRLGLDMRTQITPVEKILTDGARAAAPVGLEMIQIRKRLLELELAGKSGDLKPVLNAYTSAAAKMTGIETEAFAKVYALLKPNQKSKAPKAFELMAGLLQPPPPRPARVRGGGDVVLVSAQRGGGGGGGGSNARLSRLETLTKTFTLEKDQTKRIKAMLDDAYKTAAPVRDQLATTHAAILVSMQAGKTQAQIDETVRTYAVQAAAMTALEMKALAQLTGVLTPEQRANTAALDATFYVMRGLFLDKKKWDITDDARGY